MDDAVLEQGGIVQDHTGDGIMAVFGAPVSFEDTPLRACRAALSSCSGCKPPAVISKLNTGSSRNFGSASILGPQSWQTGRRRRGCEGCGRHRELRVALAGACCAEFGLYERGNISLVAGKGRGDFRGRASDQG